jgi:hypothetical protein
MERKRSLSQAPRLAGAIVRGPSVFPLGTPGVSYGRGREPSMTGGAKIARIIAEVATTHDFAKMRSVIYT